MGSTVYVVDEGCTLSNPELQPTQYRQVRSYVVPYKFHLGFFDPLPYPGLYSWPEEHITDQSQTSHPAGGHGLWPHSLPSKYTSDGDKDAPKASFAPATTRSTVSIRKTKHRMSICARQLRSSETATSGLRLVAKPSLGTRLCLVLSNSKDGKAVSSESKTRSIRAS